jgi:hypothetical protein
MLLSSARRVEEAKNAVAETFVGVVPWLAQKGMISYSPNEEGLKPVCIPNRSTIRIFTWESNFSIWNKREGKYYEPNDPEFRNELEMSIAGIRQSMYDSRLATIVPIPTCLGEGILDPEFSFELSEDSKNHVVRATMTYWGHEVSSDGIL